MKFFQDKFEERLESAVLRPKYTDRNGRNLLGEGEAELGWKFNLFLHAIKLEKTLKKVLDREIHWAKILQTDPSKLDSMNLANAIKFGERLFEKLMREHADLGNPQITGSPKFKLNEEERQQAINEIEKMADKLLLLVEKFRREIKARTSKTIKRSYKK